MLSKSFSLYDQNMSLGNSHKAKIIQQLFGHNKMPVSVLSKNIHKSIPYTTTLISELIEDEILEECGLAESKGGRRPQLYSIKKDVFYIVAVALNQIKTTFAIFDLNGDQVFKPKTRNIVLSRTGEDLVQLGAFIKECIEKSGIDHGKILGIGIGMPGFVNVKKGQNHSFLKCEGRSLVDYLRENTGLPVFIDNDSSLIALAELRQGLARNLENALVINIGWGVGLGIIIDHEVFRGENGYAGEFSHIPLFDNRKVCSCGKLGCLETECSLSVLIEKAREGMANKPYSILPESLPEDKTEAIETIFNAIQQGDSYAINLLNYLGHNLGRGISILIHLFNPGVILLSGPGSIPGKYWWAPVQQAINEYSIGKLAENTEVRISKLGALAELVGAATLVVEKLQEIIPEEHLNRIDRII